MLNHWDNPEGTIERGYAGSSLWKWYDLPETVDPRYADYARANASIGINGTVVNNVNASARFLTAEYLHKVAALAGVFRKYGIKTYLSFISSLPKRWRIEDLRPARSGSKKVVDRKNEGDLQYYPDFGGFLVKANSEGEPGPQDYGRTHADGANMLAEALAPFKGVVIWRAFVYKADPNADRFKAAYEEFAPLDGKFAKNVIVQVKNGPIDFQPASRFRRCSEICPKRRSAWNFSLHRNTSASQRIGFTRPRFSRMPRRRYLCKRQRLHRRPNRRRFAARLPVDLHCRRGQYRLRPQLDRPPDGASQLVCLRETRLGPHTERGSRCKRMDAAYIDHRGKRRHHDRRYYAAFKGYLCGLQHTARLVAPMDGQPLCAGALAKPQFPPRLDSHLLPPGRFPGPGIRPHSHRQQRITAVPPRSKKRMARCRNLPTSPICSGSITFPGRKSSAPEETSGTNFATGSTPAPTRCCGCKNNGPGCRPPSIRRSMPTLPAG